MYNWIHDFSVSGNLRGHAHKGLYETCTDLNQIYSIVYNGQSGCFALYLNACVVSYKSSASSTKVWGRVNYIKVEV